MKNGIFSVKQLNCKNRRFLLSYSAFSPRESLGLREKTIAEGNSNFKVAHFDFHLLWPRKRFNNLYQSAQGFTLLIGYYPISNNANIK